MKNTVCVSIVLVFAGLLICNTFAVAGEAVSPDRVPAGIGNPLLADVNKVAVRVTLNPAAETDGAIARELEQKVKTILRASDINVATEVDAGLAEGVKQAFGYDVNIAVTPIDIAELRFNIDVLKLADTNQYIFHSQAVLAKKASFGKVAIVSARVDVWKSDSIMKAVSAGDLRESLDEAIGKQAGEFINTRSAARSVFKNILEAQPMKTSKTGKGRVKKDVKSEKQSEEAAGFVSSKNSKIFHKQGCSFAQNIEPKNLVNYESKEEAIEAGKRPCKKCNP